MEEYIDLFQTIQLMVASFFIGVVITITWILARIEDCKLALKEAEEEIIHEEEQLREIICKKNEELSKYKAIKINQRSKLEYLAPLLTDRSTVSITCPKEREMVNSILESDETESIVPIYKRIYGEITDE